MIYVIIWFACAIIARAIAQNKGNKATPAFILGFLFGPIGVLIVLAQSSNMMQCPNCAENVKPEAKICKHCGTRFA